ncbi:hypothetical protein L9F63_010778, partial [Diploptera punctata]
AAISTTVIQTIDIHLRKAAVCSRQLLQMHAALRRNDRNSGSRQLLQMHARTRRNVDRNSGS